MAIVSVTESLRARMGAILAPLRGERGLPLGYRLAEVETEQGVTLRIEAAGIEARSLLVELEARDEARPCYARTGRFNVYYSTVGGRSRNLTDAERAVMDVVVKVLQEREGALPVRSEPSEPSRRIAVREVEVDRALVDEGDGTFYVNPYVGCMLACPFCYAIHRADFSRALSGTPPMPWGRWVDAKPGVGAVLAREARALADAGGAPRYVRMSPIVTDPYQPLERRYRVTRSCLEALRGTSLVPVVLTRSSSVLEDLPLLRELGGLVGMSVTTDDDAVRAAFEPETESIAARVSALRALRDAGLQTFAVVQPMLPMDPARLVEALAPLVHAVRIGPLYEKHRAAEIAARIGRPELLDPAWEAATFETLREGFEARGVLVNPTSDPWRSFLR